MDDGNELLEELRRMNLVAPNTGGYPRGAPVPQQSQPQAWQYGQPHLDAETAHFASALESAFGGGPVQQYPMPPRDMGYMNQMHTQPMQYHHPPPHAPPPGYGMYAGHPSHMRDMPRIPLKYTEGMIHHDSARMKGWEIAKIIKQQLAAVQTGDEYSDDYYSIKYQSKLSENPANGDYSSGDKTKIRPTDLLAEMDAVLHSSRLDDVGHNRPAHGTPLPRAAFSQPTDQTDSLRKKTTEWHESHNVLGRSVRTNLKRPRELIALIAPAPLMEEVQKQETESQTQPKPGHVGSIGGTAPTFQSQTWVMRTILNQVAAALLEIDDVHRLLEAKVSALRQLGESSSGFASCQSVVRELQVKQLNLCNKLGVLLGFPSVVDNGVCNESVEVELVGGWDTLFFLIWTPKGRRLVLKAVPCLLKPHMRSMLRTMCQNCAYFLCRNPDGQDEYPCEDIEAVLDLKAAACFSDEFRQLTDLAFVTDCLKITRELFHENPQVLSVFVHIPAGQEMIRCMLQHGKQLMSSCGDTVKSEWVKESDRFYEMMQIAVRSLEENSSA